MILFAGYLFVYFTILIMIGFIFRSADLSESFFFAGYKKNTFSITASLIATILGGSATIGLVGMASRKGMPASWWLLFGGIGLILLAVIFAKNIYGLKLRTIIDLLKIYDSPTVEKAGAVFIIIAWCGVISGQITAASKLIDAVFMINNHRIMILIVGAAILIYTVIGGQKAVIATDMIQLFLIIPALLLLFIFLFSKNIPLLEEKQHLQFPLNHHFQIKDWLNFAFTLIPMYLFGPDIYNKLLCTKSIKKGKKILYISSLVIGIFAFLISYIGIKGSYVVKSLDGEPFFFI